MSSAPVFNKGYLTDLSVNLIPELPPERARYAADVEVRAVALLFEHTNKNILRNNFNYFDLAELVGIARTLTYQNPSEELFARARGHAKNLNLHAVWTMSGDDPRADTTRALLYGIHSYLTEAQMETSDYFATREVDIIRIHLDRFGVAVGPDAAYILAGAAFLETGNDVTGLFAAENRDHVYADPVTLLHDRGFSDDAGLGMRRYWEEKVLPSMDTGLGPMSAR